MVFAFLALLVLTGLGLLGAISLSLIDFGMKMRPGDAPEAPAEEPALSEKDKESAHHRAAFEWIKTHPYEDVSIESEDGLLLRGWYFPCPGAENAALCMPGWTDTKEQFYGEAKVFFDLGLNVLVPDQRAMGQSGGQFCTFGDKERGDAGRWLKLLREKGNKRLVMFGRSMGAATAMLTVSGNDAADVVCAVEDCGYTSMRDELFSFIRSRARWVPPFLFPLLGKIARPLIFRKTGCRMEEASPISALPACRVPILFIHGTEDTFVPFDMMPDLFSAHPGPKEKMAVEGAAHARNLALGGVRYIETVHAFVKKYL